jgi:hypothetical protein
MFFILVLSTGACTGSMSTQGDKRISQRVSSILGVYRIDGEDGLGKYTGQAEIYSNSQGEALVGHIREYNTLKYKNHKVAVAWTGVIKEMGSKIQILWDLDDSGYITESQGYVRSEVSAAPIRNIGEISEVPGNSIVLTINESNGKAIGTERWSDRASGDAEKPLWVNKRVRIASHAAPSQSKKDNYWRLFANYRTLPEVVPYINHPDFINSIHFSEFDPTDFEFYRDRKDVVRVIQKTLNPASMQEALRRKMAYSMTLKEKEYELARRMVPGVERTNINSLGMVSYGDGSHNVDSLLWTGVYVASQAFRYIVTGSMEAYRNMLFSLDGMILCHTITGDPGDFARTIRLKRSFGVLADRSWHQGTGANSNVEWLDGANNDMLKGYFIAFAAASQAIRKKGGDDSYLKEMESLMSNLLNNNNELFDNTQRAVNKTTAQLLIISFTNDLVERIKMQAEYEVLFKVAKKIMETSLQYDNGITDWSGNNLHAVNLLANYLLTEQLNHKNSSYLEEIARISFQRAGNLRSGFVREVFSLIGWKGPQQPKDFIWDLREFIAPKINSDPIDWRRSWGFSLSPYPSLPWKGDWMTEDRFQPIVSYPYFEQSSTNHQWKSLPQYRGEIDGRGNFSADFLVAYWTARYFGALGPND